MSTARSPSTKRSNDGHGNHLPPDWKIKSLGEIANLHTGGTPSREIATYWNGTIPWITTSLVNFGIIDAAEEFITSDGVANSAAKVFPKGTLLMAMFGQGVTRGKTAVLGIDAAFNQACVGIVPRPEVHTHFIYQFLQHHYEAIRNLANTGSQANLNAGLIRALEITIPPLAEQQAIVTVLSAWDRAIERTTALIVAKDRLKQGLMQQLLSGRRRFPKFRGEPFRPMPLDTVLSKVSRAVDVEPSKTYREIGIRSHGKGIFHKEPVHGETLGEKRVYEVVPGCLALNIVFAWERAIAITTTRESGMIASHRFPMFQPNPEKVVIEYVLHYLLSDVGSHVLKLASPGGAGRNRTISQEQLLKTVIPLPSVAEQRRIVETVKAAEDELMSLRTALMALKQQKRGLMQQLLSGQRRVPSSLLKKEVNQ